MSKSEAATWPFVDRRVLESRRGRANYTVRGKRTNSRRVEDAVNSYVDRYSMRWFILATSIIILSCVDAMFTLQLIMSGTATEANPIMRAVMEQGELFFLGAKLGLTALGIVILLRYKNFLVFKYVKVKYILCSVLVMYVALIKYELWLFSLPPLI